MKDICSFYYQICVQEKGCHFYCDCCEEDWSEAFVDEDGLVVRLCLIFSHCYSVLQKLVSYSYFVNYSKNKRLHYLFNCELCRSTPVHQNGTNISTLKEKLTRKDQAISMLISLSFCLYSATVKSVSKSQSL